MTGSAPRPLRFARAQRLKLGRDFQKAKAEGRRAASGCLVANWLEHPPQGLSRLGVITSRKLGNAVVRSRARRLLRESFRLHQHDLIRPLDLVLVARNSIVGKSRAGVEDDLLRVLKMNRLLRDAPSAGAQAASPPPPPS